MIVWCFLVLIALSAGYSGLFRTCNCSWGGVWGLLLSS